MFKVANVLKIISTSLFLRLSVQLQAQMLTGTIVDEKTKQPISYVNIGVIGKNMGTVSNDMGNFELSLDQLSDSDTIRFSMITHHPKDFLVHSLRSSTASLMVELKERTIKLNEVVIQSSTKRTKTLVWGIERKQCYPVPFNQNITSNIKGFAKYPGEEIGVHFSLTGKKYRLDSIEVNVLSAETDTTKFRVNVYKLTGESLLLRPVYVTFSKNEITNSPIINLSDQYITVESDFIVALENIEGVGGLVILASFKNKATKYPGLQRKNSQSDWKPIDSMGLGSGSTGISIVAFLNE